MLLCPQLSFSALWSHKSRAFPCGEATLVSAAASSWLRHLWSQGQSLGSPVCPCLWNEPVTLHQTVCSREQIETVTQCLVVKRNRKNIIFCSRIQKFSSALSQEFLGILLSCGELLRVCWALEQRVLVLFLSTLSDASRAMPALGFGQVLHAQVASAP